MSSFGASADYNKFRQAETKYYSGNNLGSMVEQVLGVASGWARTRSLRMANFQIVAAHASSVTITVTATARDSHHFELLPPLALALREILTTSLYQPSQVHLKFSELKVQLNSLSHLLLIADERPHEIRYRFFLLTLDHHQ
ncbi:hypothetical protein VF21_02518 [Pseudogymnoascus sp. 05NY08]|nr:hypothetical protein VF21_02518 [Pseudogymnoascus sp. 05NY08]